MPIAITRPVPQSLARCELTHLARTPIDVARAAGQHALYETALAAMGCTLRHLPAADELPDSVFVEDIALVLDEMAIVMRPGAASRRDERPSVAAVLSEYRTLHAIAAPGTMDGGDVLRVGKTLYVGLSRRTNEDGVHQLARIVEPFGYGVTTVETRACLHLKSAATAIDDDRVLCNPEWIDASVFRGVETIAVDASEAHAANVLRVGNLRSRGYRVHAVDVSELAKAEAGVTCCSVIV
jgi:dimethylargininase